MADPSVSAIKDKLNSKTGTTPANADMFIDWSTEAGDVLNIAQGQTTYKVPVYVNHIKWNGAPKVQIESTGNTKREPIAKASRAYYGSGAGGAKTAQDAKEAYVLADSANGRIDIVASDIVNIKASIVNIEGRITASALWAQIGEIEHLTLPNTLYAEGGIDADMADINCERLYSNSLQVNMFAQIAELSTYSAKVNDKDVETDLAYFNGVSVTTSGSTVTLWFDVGASQSAVSVNFNKAGGEVTGVSVGDVMNTRNVAEGVYVADASTTVYSSGGTTAEFQATTNVNNAVDYGFKKGWDAAIAACKLVRDYSISGGAAMRVDVPKVASEQTDFSNPQMQTFGALSLAWYNATNGLYVTAHTNTRQSSGRYLSSCTMNGTVLYSNDYVTDPSAIRRNPSGTILTKSLTSTKYSDN